MFYINLIILILELRGEKTDPGAPVSEIFNIFVNNYQDLFNLDIVQMHR